MNYREEGMEETKIERKGREYEHCIEEKKESEKQRDGRTKERDSHEGEKKESTWRVE